MKQLNITLEDNEFDDLEQIKNISRRNWRTFILEMKDIYKQSLEGGKTDNGIQEEK